MKKYRLGNQSAEYELRENYLGWFPGGGVIKPGRI